MVNGTMNGFLLSILIWLPILGAVAVMVVGDQRPVMAKGLALLIAVVTFLLGMPLFFSFDTSTAAMQFVEMRPWIETFNIHYYLGVDGFSAPLILLTTMFSVLVVIAGWPTATMVSPGSLRRLEYTRPGLSGVSAKYDR